MTHGLRGRSVGAVLVASLVAVLGAAGTGAGAASGRNDPVVGVTRSTVTVIGIVGADVMSSGAEIGAQARFARANRGGGIAGRTIEYTANGADAAAAGTTAFAVVPAVSATLDPATLARSAVPFVGSAATVEWDGNRYGFGITGAQAALQTRVVSPAWGAQLRSLIGAAQGSGVMVVTDADTLGAARAEQARISLRAARFVVGAPITLPAPPAPPPDVGPVADAIAAAGPAAVLLLGAPSTTSALAQRLAQRGFTGTVATDAWAYQPTAPAVANGLTVLVPFAPLEQSTAASRRLIADVRAYAPDAAISAGVVVGYWSADLFVRILGVVGRRVTRARFLSAARRFTYRVPATVGPATWPAMHTQSVPCGALVQSDGTRYLVAEPYRCGRSLVRRPSRATTTTNP